MSIISKITVLKKQIKIYFRLQNNHQKFVVNVVDLFEDRQLNSDSDMYYWGC